jgi:hypothetical protein
MAVNLVTSLAPTVTLFFVLVQMATKKSLARARVTADRAKAAEQAPCPSFKRLSNCQIHHLSTYCTCVKYGTAHLCKIDLILASETLLESSAVARLTQN